MSIEDDAAHVREVHAALAGPQKLWVLTAVYVDYKHGPSVTNTLYVSKELAVQAFADDLEADLDYADAEELAVKKTTLNETHEIVVGETTWLIEEGVVHGLG